MKGARAGDCSILVTELSAVLKGITNNDVSGWSIPSAMAAAVAPPRPGCVTGDRGCTFELAQSNTFLNDLLAAVLLNHAQHEAVIRGSFESFWIRTTMSTTKVFLLLSRPRLSRSLRVGQLRRLEERSALPEYLTAASFELLT